VCTDAGCLAVVRIADCAPILLASINGRVVSAVHAGWRGVAAGVLPRAIRTMREQTGQAIVGVVGPCIGVEHFEVGQEVVAEFERAFPARERDIIIRPSPTGATGKSHIDLQAALLCQLREAGVQKFEAIPHCTVARPDLFFSHRRDRGLTGRMIGIIGCRE
jgi:polyphenol oxidase